MSGVERKSSVLRVWTAMDGVRQASSRKCCQWRGTVGHGLGVGRWRDVLAKSKSNQQNLGKPQLPLSDLFF